MTPHSPGVLDAGVNVDNVSDQDKVSELPTKPAQSTAPYWPGAYKSEYSSNLERQRAKQNSLAKRLQSRVSRASGWNFGASPTSKRRLPPHAWSIIDPIAEPGMLINAPHVVPTRFDINTDGKPFTTETKDKEFGAVLHKFRYMIVVQVFPEHIIALPIYSHRDNGISEKTSAQRRFYVRVLGPHEQPGSKPEEIIYGGLRTDNHDFRTPSFVLFSEPLAIRYNNVEGKLTCFGRLKPEGFQPLETLYWLAMIWSIAPAAEDEERGRQLDLIKSGVQHLQSKKREKVTPPPSRSPSEAGIQLPRTEDVDEPPESGADSSWTSSDLDSFSGGENDDSLVTTDQSDTQPKSDGDGSKQSGTYQSGTEAERLHASKAPRVLRDSGPRSPQTAARPDNQNKADSANVHTDGDNDNDENEGLAGLVGLRLAAQTRH